MNQQMIEYYHNEGYMPNRYYYQLNNHSAYENYIEQKEGFVSSL